MMKTDTLDLRNMDCMDLMAEYPDKHFDLAIVDPPYFDGPQKTNYYKGTKQRAQQSLYKSLAGTWEIPGHTYFDELIRVSKNQIIWGCNYYDYILRGGRIVWLKGESGSPFSMADIAYQSFYNRIDLFKYMWSGFWQQAGSPKEHRIHPTQKPVKLYDWLLRNYAKPGQRILDTHMGSGSIAIACHYFGVHLTASELDPDYYAAACERVERETQQMTLINL